MTVRDFIQIPRCLTCHERCLTILEDADANGVCKGCREEAQGDAARTCAGFVSGVAGKRLTYERLIA